MVSGRLTGGQMVIVVVTHTLLANGLLLMVVGMQQYCQIVVNTWVVLYTYIYALMARRWTIDGQMVMIGC
jgi:hypothetical protein